MSQSFSQRLNSLNKRVLNVALVNLLISGYYFYLFVASFYKFDQLPTLSVIRYGLSFLGMIIGGFFLLREKQIGKTATQFVGILGIVSIVGWTCYGFSFFGRPNYSTIIVIQGTIDYVWNVFVKQAYPIIAGFIVLGVPNDRLGLK